MLRGILKFLLFAAVIALCIGGVNLYLDRDPFASAPELVIAEKPVIGFPTMQPLRFKAGSGDDAREFILVPLASYTAFGRVLSNTRYWTQEYDNDLAPYDLALGWGAMSDRALLQHLRFKHVAIDKVRYLKWEWRDNSAKNNPQFSSTPHNTSLYSNTHIIPATADIRRQIASLNAGDFVRLKGHLVEAQLPADPQWGNWKSSVQLDDVTQSWGKKNESADELMYVTAVEIMR